MCEIMYPRVDFLDDTELHHWSDEREGLDGWETEWMCGRENGCVEERMDVCERECIGRWTLREREWMCERECFGRWTSSTTRSCTSGPTAAT